MELIFNCPLITDDELVIRLFSTEQEEEEYISRLEKDRRDRFVSWVETVRVIMSRSEVNKPI